MPLQGGWDGTGTDSGTDAKSKPLGFNGLGTMGRLYSPKGPLSPPQIRCPRFDVHLASLLVTYWHPFSPNLTC